jgi:hypothetical protein
VTNAEYFAPLGAWGSIDTITYKHFAPKGAKDISHLLIPNSRQINVDHKASRSFLLLTTVYCLLTTVYLIPMLQAGP